MRTVALIVLAALTGSEVLAQESIQGVLLSRGRSVGAEPSPAISEEPNAYGAVATTLYKVSAFDMSPFESTVVFATDSYLYRFAATSTSLYTPQLFAGLQLPSGVRLTELGAALCDTTGTQDISVALYRNPDPNGGANSVGSMSTTGTPGCEVLTVPINHTVDQSSQTYNFRVVFASDATADGFALLLCSVWVRYQLQVSPAPAAATFADVPTGYLYFRAIEALAASGITSGCGGGNFCPNQFVTRGELAKFLANALGLHWPN